MAVDEKIRLLGPLPLVISPGGFYRRRLPHWQPDGAALFITWRLHGSLPRAAAGAGSSAGVGRAFALLDRQLDAAVTGPLWLKEPVIANLVVDALSFAERELNLCRLRAWVVMPNHVHVVVFPSAPLWRITKAMKGFTGKQANRILGRTDQPFWQPESFDHWVRNRDEIERVVRYVERNPVTAGLAHEAAEWPWSSASVGQVSGPAPDRAGQESCATPFSGA